MEVRFKKKSDAVNIVITALAAVISVVMMIYGVITLGLKGTWPELVLNIFYIACLVMMWMYFFKWGITTKQFNYWCTLNIGVTVLLRDILFAPPLANFPLALLYQIDILIEPSDQFTTYLMVEIWIRPTITYGLVACYVNEASSEE